MTLETLNRLLKRQIRKHNIPEELITKHESFFRAINDAYKSSESDLSHLEHVLELSSKELYLANRQLQEEKKEVTVEALRSKNQLDKVMANVTDIIFEVDSNGNFTYLNSAWEEYSEVSVEESLGRNFMEFSDGIKHFDSNVQDKISKRDFETFETSFSRYDGSGQLKWWEMNVKLLQSVRGEVEGAIGSLVNVTEMKDTEYALKKANRAKSRFLSTMSHEIRTPLNAVIAISNILLMDDPKEAQLENLQALKFSSKHLLNLINDILDYNKLVSGKLNFDNSDFNLKKIVKGTMNSFSFSADEKGIALEQKISSNVPSLLKGDSLRLSQVLTNLIGNAIKFTDEGKVSLSVENVGESEGRVKLRFSTTDTGIGIADDKLKSIFDRFTQAEANTTKLYGGTGLGLAICRQLLELQGSQINVESALGKGTTFWFDLEFGESVKTDLTRIDPEHETQFDLKGMKLLVVDDNDMNLMVITQFFEKWNVSYNTAKNGQEAVDMVKNNTYDLVLMDLQMPVLNGYEAVNQIRSMGGRHLTLPIIALSASVSNEIIVKVVEAGMNGYLSKPFDPVDLYGKLNKFVSPHHKVK